MRYARFGATGLAVVAAAGFGVLGGCGEAGYETTETEMDTGATDTGLGGTGADLDTQQDTGTQPQGQQPGAGGPSQPMPEQPGQQPSQPGGVGGTGGGM